MLANQESQHERVLVRYRNRAIRAADIAFIKSVMASSPAMGRTRISRELCSAWDWRQPNGALKEYACRDLLLRLEEWGFLRLPPRLKKRSYGNKRSLRHLDLGPEPAKMANGDL